MADYPYYVTCPMMHLMLPILPIPTPPPREETDACENINFPQLRLRAVIIFYVLTPLQSEKSKNLGVID